MALRLLVVDDEIRVLRSLTRTLRFKGAEVLAAGGSREALELLVEHEVDAVITDHHMPRGPSGIWLLENVAHRYPSVRRILFSGRVVSHAEELVKLGMVHCFLRKPITASDVLAASQKLDATQNQET